AVQCRRIVSIPEIIQQFLVRNFLRIEFDLRDLGVAGAAGAHVVVTWVFRVPAGEAARDVHDSRHLLEFGFHAPETAAAERGKFSWTRGPRSLIAIHSSLIGIR